MRKKFVANLALVLILNLLVKPFWIFGIDRAMQNKLGADVYGSYFALYGFSLLLNILLDLGLNNFNIRNISQNDKLLSKHFSKILPLKILVSLLYLSVSMIVAYFLGYDPSQLYLLFFLLLNQVFLSLILYFRSNISALQKYSIDSFISVIDKLLMIVICSMMLWLPIFQEYIHIEYFVYSQTISLLIGVFISFFVIYKHIDIFKPHIDFPFLIVIFRKSYPFALLVLLMSFYNRIDSVMLERLLPISGREQAGIYAQSFRILEALGNFSLLFAGLLLPMFSRMLAEKQNIENLTQLASKLLLIPAMMIVVFGSFHSMELMQILYHQHTEISASIFVLILCCFVPISISYIYGTLLTANGSLKYLNIMAASSMLLNITLNFILIPLFSAKGAAIASLCTQIYSCIFQFVLVRKFFNFKIGLISWVKNSIFIFLLLAIVYSLDKYLQNMVLELILFLGITAPLLFLLKIVDLKELKENLQKRG